MKNYQTQMEAARRGIITPEMQTVAEKEHIDAEVLRDRVARGTVAIPANRNHTALSGNRRGSAHENQRESRHFRRLQRLYR